MAKTFVLDKVLKQGIAYRTHPRVALKINKIGTDSTSAVHLNIDGKVLGDIVKDVAPLYFDNTKINGPLDIRRLPYVVPPDTDFLVEGPSGAKLRIVGTLYQLAPGEAIPGDIMARFDEQPNRFIRYVTGSYSFGAATSWAADTEVEVFTLTPSSIETFLFNDLLMFKYAGFTPSPGDVAVLFYIDSNPIEYLISNNLYPGIDILSIPHQADVAKNLDVFRLSDFPIELTGPHNISIKCKNVSGAPISLSSASITFYAVCEYKKSK